MRWFRRRWLLLSLVVTLPLIIGSPLQAVAAADRVCSPLIIDEDNWGGSYFCNYGFEQDSLQNENFEVWVAAGSNHNVYTLWETPNGRKSEWVNMGATVKHNGNSSHLAAYMLVYDHHFDELIRIIGTNGKAYCNIRSGTRNSWSGWSGRHCKAVDGW